jgi:hypothetical protein
MTTSPQSAASLLAPAAHRWPIRAHHSVKTGPDSNPNAGNSPQMSGVQNYRRSASRAVRSQCAIAELPPSHDRFCIRESEHGTGRRSSIHHDPIGKSAGKAFQPEK